MRCNAILQVGRLSISQMILELRSLLKLQYSHIPRPHSESRVRSHFNRVMTLSDFLKFCRGSHHRHRISPSFITGVCVRSQYDDGGGLTMA